MKICGMDPSLRSWGIAKGNWSNGALELYELGVCNPTLTTGKQVRQNSLDIESAKQLFAYALAAAKDADAVFVEVPIGSQSARAMAGYAICCGVLGALRATGIPFIEVTPTEVKLAGPGNKTATKQEMIDWAVAKHPEALWPLYTRKGEKLVNIAKAEHMADAVAAIYAGLDCNFFKQLLPFLAAQPKGIHYANQPQTIRNRSSLEALHLISGD